MESKLRDDLKSAQLSGNQRVVMTLRLLLSEIRNVEIQKGSPITDEDILSVIQKEIKKRNESAAIFRSANREELVEKEEGEATILQGYLPQQLSEEELNQIIEKAIKDNGASTISDMGKIIGIVRSQVGQRANGSTISSLVKTKLG